MQLWMNAMLAVSVLLIVWDMAKIFSKKKKTRPIYDSSPQKEHIERYARSFQKLAHTFYELPDRQEQLNSEDIRDIFDKVRKNMCSSCPMEVFCWEERKNQTCQRVFEFLKVIEDGNPDKILRERGEWLAECSQAVSFTQEIEKEFFRAREELFYRNHMIESRMAVAEQLNEVAHLIRQMAVDVTDLTTVPEDMEEKIKKQLQKQRVLVSQVWMLSKPDEKWRLFLTMRTRGGQCVTMREVGRQLSDICGCSMVPAGESRSVLNNTMETVMFIQEVNYKVLYGVARMTKEKETVSGDNFACSSMDDQFVMCLSDGMGSGMEACKESETVVDLLDQFVLAGFSRETAARMVNSALVLQRKGGMFSSMDVCSLDLYTGMCEFLKAGAASTFIKRSGWIETITSSSMAAGLVWQLDIDKTVKKLYEGDYLVMVTDGVLDALPPAEQENIMKEILLSASDEMPEEIGRYILERVLSYSNHRVVDDMTILVAGMWKK